MLQQKIEHLFSDGSCISKPLPSGLLGQASCDDGRDAVVTLKLSARNFAGPRFDFGKLHFGRNFPGQILILEYLINTIPKMTIIYLTRMD
jgi:hypothetical protein